MSDPMTMLDGMRAAEGLTCSIEDLGPVGQITLKGDLSDPTLGAAVEAAVGVGVPAPLGALFNADRGAIWMAGDEVLLLVPYVRAPAVTAELTGALAQSHHMAVDVSDARAVLGISGPGAQELMAKGAPLDVSDAAFPVGTARRTHFAEIAVGIWRREPEVWQMMCFQSYAPHLFAWLVASAGEEAKVGYF